MVKSENWGTHKGKDVYLFTLSNGKDLSATITNYGGILRSLVYKGTDVVLGRDGLDAYLNNTGCYGALIGRNSNRIADGEFELNGKKYVIAKNDVYSNCHSGPEGFDHQVWDAETLDGVEPSLVLKYVSPDGDQGFPAQLDVKVTYTLTSDNSLKIHYEATGDGDTIVNLTNHAYFNLNGHTSGTVDNHTIKSECDFYTPNVAACYPTGEILSVAGTTFDLRDGKKLGDCFVADDEQIKMFGGFDHNFAIRGTGFRKAMTLIGDKTGITMETYTDQLGVQIYSGNGIKESEICKDGAGYKIHQGICFETQAFPDAPHNSHFPSTVLKKGEKYDSVTEYKFK